MSEMSKDENLEANLEAKVITKSPYKIRQFLNAQLKEGTLLAYEIEINKEQIIADNKTHRYIKIKKGATLEPTMFIVHHSRLVFLKDPTTKIKYNLAFYNNGEYDVSLLERLSGNINLRQVSQTRAQDKHPFLHIPYEHKQSTLQINHPAKQRFSAPKLTVIGQLDDFMNVFLDYIESEEIEHF